MNLFSPRLDLQTINTLTITDPNITRYLMSIPEADQLVMQANAISKVGDVFVLGLVIQFVLET